jgi:hypothetical protein
MTNLSSYTWQGGAPESADGGKRFARKAAEVALAVLVAAALTGAWLALFIFVPLEVAPPRVR